MSGGDLKCVKCGAQATDVAHDLDLESFFGQLMGIEWKCLNGHRQISGVRNPKKGWESMLVAKP